MVLIYNIRINDVAKCDLSNIIDYCLSKDGSGYAASVVQDYIISGIKKLNVNPERGAILGYSGKWQLRRIHTKKYNIYFAVDKQARIVEVLGVSHAHRRVVPL